MELGWNPDSGNSGMETILLELVGWKPEWEIAAWNPDSGK